MFSGTHAHSHDNDILRASLSRWAARLTRDPIEQKRLIDQTVAVALDDPDVLDAQDVQEALKRVMERLTASAPITRASDGRSR